MLEGGALIVQVGSDVHGGRVLALDPATGKERWSSNGPGPGYASPLAVTIEGVRQIITMTNGSIIGIDASNGAPLWSIPFPDEWHENIVTPIWTGRALIVSGTRQGTHAYALARAGGAWQPKQLWKNADVTMYTVSPVFADGMIYGMSNKRRGHFVALDVENGAVKWATQGRDGTHASILQTKDHLLFLTDAGVLIVARRTPEGFKEEKRYELGTGATWSLPVLLADGLLVRETDRVVKLNWN
jgi:outer membrane protein assembly factor BamB